MSDDSIRKITAYEWEHSRGISSVVSLSADADGLFATSSWDHTIKVWATTKHESERTLTGEKEGS